MKDLRQAFLRADSLRADGDMTGIAAGFSGSVLSGHSELFRINNLGDPIRGILGVEKGFMALHTKLDHAPSILFLNTHTHPTNQKARVAQMLQLAGYILDHADGLPLVLSGDLNAVPDSLETRILENVVLLRDSYAEFAHGYRAECTYCADNPLSWSSENRVIDYTFLRSTPALALSAENASINFQGQKRQPLSDHYGRRTIVGWQTREPKLLDPQDPSVASRRQLARVTLEEARRLLADSGDSRFFGMAEYAIALKRKIDSRQSGPVDTIYRTP
jgi:endonuclease/exonuclease/phosphatase family metal-dependent hydrolase